MTKQSLMQSISRYNVGTLEELSKLNIHDFGIFLELEPDEEEKQILEQNIQIALKAGQIELEDAIDIREVNNLKLANQMLKKRRKDKAQRDQLIQQQNIQAQAEANAKSQQAAAQAEIQKNQARTQLDNQLEITRADLRLKHLQEEVRLKKELMQYLKN